MQSGRSQYCIKSKTKLSRVNRKIEGMAWPRGDLRCRFDHVARLVQSVLCYVVMCVPFLLWICSSFFCQFANAHAVQYFLCLEKASLGVSIYICS